MTYVKLKQIFKVTQLMILIVDHVGRNVLKKSSKIRLVVLGLIHWLFFSLLTLPADSSLKENLSLFLVLIKNLL